MGVRLKHHRDRGSLQEKSKRNSYVPLPGTGYTAPPQAGMAPHQEGSPELTASPVRKEHPGCTSSCPSNVSNFLGVPTAALAAETQTDGEEGRGLNNQHLDLGRMSSYLQEVLTTSFTQLQT